MCWIYYKGCQILTSRNSLPRFPGSSRIPRKWREPVRPRTYLPHAPGVRMTWVRKQTPSNYYIQNPLKWLSKLIRWLSKFIKHRYKLYESTRKLLLLWLSVVANLNKMSLWLHRRTSQFSSSNLVGNGSPCAFMSKCSRTREHKHLNTVQQNLRCK